MLFDFEEEKPKQNQNTVPVSLPKTEYYYEPKPILVHEDKISYLLNLIYKNLIPSCLLISGEYGIGKNTAIRELIKRYLNFENIDSHPDVFFLNSAEDEDSGLELIYKNKIKVDNVRQMIDFCYKASSVSAKKFIVIDHIDFISSACANAMLKTLEEPPLDTVLFLISHNPQTLIKTIRSRCIELAFRSPSNLECDSIIPHISQDIKQIASYSPGLAIILENLGALTLYEKIASAQGDVRSLVKKSDLNLCLLIKSFVLKTQRPNMVEKLHHDWYFSNLYNLNPNLLIHKWF